MIWIFFFLGVLPVPRHCKSGLYQGSQYWGQYWDREMECLALMAYKNSLIFPLGDGIILSLHIFVNLLPWYIILDISMIFSDNHCCWMSTKFYFLLDSFAFYSWKFCLKDLYFTLWNVFSYGRYSLFLELFIFQTISLLSTWQFLCLFSLLVIIAF